jgi:hypothetical protein
LYWTEAKKIGCKGAPHPGAALVGVVETAAPVVGTRSVVALGTAT